MDQKLKRNNDLINIVKEKKEGIIDSSLISLCDAMNELGNIKDVSAIDPIFEVFAFGDRKNVEGHQKAHEYYIKDCALQSLLSMGADILFNSMIEKLDSSATDKKTRSNAIKILGILGDKRAIDYIKRAEKEDPDQEVRNIAVQTLHGDFGASLRKKKNEPIDKN